MVTFTPCCANLSLMCFQSNCFCSLKSLDLKNFVVNKNFSPKKSYKTAFSGWPLVGNEGINLYIGILGIHEPSFPTKGQPVFRRFYRLHVRKTKTSHPSNSSSIIPSPLSRHYNLSCSAAGEACQFQLLHPGPPRWIQVQQVVLSPGEDGDIGGEGSNLKPHGHQLILAAPPKATFTPSNKGFIYKALLRETNG